MRLLGNRPPPNWPVKVFWVLVIIHLPIMAVMAATDFVHKTILDMVAFWTVKVPSYLLSLLLNPLLMVSAVIGAFLVWYLARCDWTPFMQIMFGWHENDCNFIRGRELHNDYRLRQQLGSRRMTLRGPGTNAHRRINQR